MPTLDPLISALIALCSKEGGHKSVADKAKISPDNLAQIIAGTKLPSGNPRGVGPGIRAKLTAAFPDWMPITVGTAATPVFNIAPSQTLEAHLLGLSKYLSALDESERDLAGVLLAQLAKRPEDYQRVARMIQGSVDAANAAVETGRRQKFTSSGGQ